MEEGGEVCRGREDALFLLVDALVAAYLLRPLPHRKEFSGLARLVDGRAAAAGAGVDARFAEEDVHNGGVGG